VDADRQEAIFRDLADSRAVVDGLLARADPRSWVNEGTGRRVVDVIAHVAQWEVYAAASLEAFAAGGEFRLPSPFDIHEVNERIFREHRERDPAEVRAFLVASRARLLAAARGVPPDRWAGPVTYPWGAHGTVDELLVDMRGHDGHHAAQIRRAAETS
jgi:hypothetical protein